MSPLLPNQAVEMSNIPVSSIRDSANLHWVHALGIVDNDRRPEADINQLKEKGIYALAVISVESIYYHPHIQDLIAQRQANLIGGDAPHTLIMLKLLQLRKSSHIFNV
jgi:hypothetical protein